MPTFDTVSDVKAWLEEEPEADAVREAIEEERDGEDRVTALEALESYLDDITDDESATDGVAYRANREVDGYEIGEIVHLDPEEAAMRVRDGSLRRWSE